MRTSEHQGVPPQHPGRTPGTMGIASHSEKPPDDDLSESSFELLSKSILDASDDECRTVSVASTDDLSSLSDEDDSEIEDSGNGYLDESPQHLSPAVEASSMCHASAEESLMTSSAETQPGDKAFVRLDEIALGDDTDAVDVQGVIREFCNESELPDVLKDYRVPHIRLSVKASVSRRWLPISRPFRLLYVGGLDRWAVTHINTHIGAALNATPSSSRFYIVQGSTFDGSPSSSKVQLEPSGSELVVDHCATPTIEEDGTGDLHAVITLDDGQKIIFGPRKCITPSTASLPDLVIIGHPAGHETNQNPVRDILKQHDIPIIEIAVVRLYGSAFEFRPDDLRLSLEGRHSPSDDFETLSSIPIDLYAFLSLDPAQVNRHLAYLNEHSPTVKLGTATALTGKKRPLRRTLLNASNNTTTAANVGNAVEPVKRRLWADYARFLPALLVLLLAILGPLAASGVLQSLYSNGSDVTTHVIPSTTPLETTAAPISSSITPTSSLSPRVSSHVSKDLTVVPLESRPRAGWLDRAMPHKGSRVDYFNITVTGDHQFELHVSQSKPKIQILVTRDSDTVPVEVMRLDANTFAVRLENKYPLTTFNVTVVVLRKPTLRQSIQVQLGRNGMWYSLFSCVPSGNQYLPTGMPDHLARLAELVKGDLAVAQTNIKHSVEAMRNAQSKWWLSKAGEFDSDLFSTLRWKKQLENSKLKVSESIQRAKEAAEDVKSQLWLQSRPLRTSPALLQTRERALRLRCNIEKSLGRRGTRSCRLVGESG